MNQVVIVNCMAVLVFIFSIVIPKSFLYFSIPKNKANLSIASFIFHILNFDFPVSRDNRKGYKELSLEMKVHFNAVKREIAYLQEVFGGE